MQKLQMDSNDKTHLVWKIQRITESAISLVDSDRIDEALALVENRDRAINILMKKNNISLDDFKSLEDLDKLNSLLLEKFLAARDRIKSEIQATHKNNEAHKAYHSGQVK